MQPDPKTALDRLLEGNRRFIAGEAIPDARRVDRIGEHVADQNPFAAVLGCSDSRVPVEVVFDVGFGDLFPVRLAGSVATTEAISSLEYAVSVLRTPLVVVLGHTYCGAVTAAREGGSPPGNVAALLEHIDVGPAGATLDESVAANVRRQIDTLRRTSSVIVEAVEAGTCALLGGVYDLESGRVDLLD